MYGDQKPSANTSNPPAVMPLLPLCPLLLLSELVP